MSVEFSISVVDTSCGRLAQALCLLSARRAAVWSRHVKDLCWFCSACDALARNFERLACEVILAVAVSSAERCKEHKMQTQHVKDLQRKSAAVRYMCTLNCVTRMVRGESEHNKLVEAFLSTPSMWTSENDFGRSTSSYPRFWIHHFHRKPIYLSLSRLGSFN